MNKKTLLFLCLLVAAIFGLYQLKYYLGYASDLRSRPWAYSVDPGAKLLVGKWQGSFTDPAGTEKRISLEIFLPVTEEERRKRASNLRKKSRSVGNRPNKQAFDGAAVVTSSLGEERYELYGAVEKSDMHQLSFHFRPEDEAKRILPNNAVAQVPAGRWEGDRLEIALTFTRLDERGFSSTQSEGVVVDGKLVWQDSPADQPAQVVLSRSAP